MTSKLDPTRFADGVRVAKADLRDAFDTARQELQHGGFTQSAGPEHPPRRVADRFGEMLSVKDFGAVGDDETDDSAAFQAAIDTGRAIYVPNGTYRIVQGLKVRGGRDMESGTQCILIGEAGGMFGTGPLDVPRPKLRYDPVDPETDEPLLTRERGWLQANQRPNFTAADGVSTTGSASVILKNLHFVARHGRSSSAVDLHLVNRSHFENCWFESRGRGLTLWSQAFDNVLINIVATHSGGENLYDLSDTADKQEYLDNTWAVSLDGHALVYGLWVNGYGTALRAAGKGTSIYGCRIEYGYNGIVLGGKKFQYDGPQPHMTRGFHLSGLSLELMETSLHLKWCKSTTVSGFDAYGYGRSKIGLLLEDVDDTCRVEGGLLQGNFSTAAIVNHSRIPLWNVRASVGSGTPAAVGGQNLPLATTRNDGAAYHFLGTTMFPEAANEARRTMTAFHDLMLPGLTGLNIRDFGGEGEPHEGGPAFAKNLGGTATPEGGATSVDVTFWSEPNFGLLHLGEPKVEADADSKLEPGTYYYACTMIEPHGETPVNNKVGDKWFKSIEVQKSEHVRLWFYDRDWSYERRIYRGRAPGQFDGYWDLGNSREALVDDGTRPFDGKGMPPMATHSHIPSRVEDDANYQIVATPSWHTTVIVTNKATTGFSVEFGTPPPDDRQSVAWLLFRP